MAPDLRRKVDATRAAREAREADMKKQADAQVRILSFSCVCQKDSLCFFFEVFSFSSDLIETIKSWFRDPLISKTSVTIHFYFYCLG